jgi:hypothetical protein
MFSKVKTSHALSVVCAFAVLTLVLVGQFNQATNDLVPVATTVHRGHSQLAQVASLLDGPPSLIGWWKLDDGSGTVAADSSSGGNNGTLVGFPADGSGWVDGKVGKALNFDGVTSEVSLGNIAAAVNIPAISFGGWVKVAPGLSGSFTLTAVSKYRSGQGSWTEYYSGTSRSFGCRIFSASGNGSAAGTTFPSASNPATDGAWHHVMCTYDGSNIVVYTDGVADKAVPFSGNVSNRPDLVCIGSEYNGNTCANNYWHGSLDDIRIYNRALSATEVGELYALSDVQNSVAPPQSPQSPSADQSVVQNAAPNGAKAPAVAPAAAAPAAPVAPAPKIVKSQFVANQGQLSNSAEVVGSEALQAFPNDALWSFGVNFRPGNGDIVNVNPPQFSWLYSPDPTVVKNNNKDIEVKQFIFQTSYDLNFSTYVNNVPTPLNFYNTLAPFNSGSTVYWRVGYIHNGDTVPYVWSKTRSFTVASGATVWDRSMLADSGSGDLSPYLASHAVHPHMLFTSATAPALDQYLDSNGGASWTSNKAAALTTIQQTWWPNQPPNSVWAGDWAQQVGNVLFVFSMASSSPSPANQALASQIRSAHPEQALVNLASYYKAQNGPTTDLITNQSFNQMLKTLSFGYDWLYPMMSPAQRQSVLEPLALRASCIVNGFGWFYQSVTPPWNGWESCDPSDHYTGSTFAARGGYSAFKTGSSHGIDNFTISMLAAMSAYGDSDNLRQLFDFGINYMLGVVFPYGTDGSSEEGRPYSTGSLFSFDNGNVLYDHILAQTIFPDARFNLNPYWSAANNWWDAIEPVDFTQGHEPWGDTGTGAVNDWHLIYFGRDLAYFLGNAQAYQHFLNEDALTVAGSHASGLAKQIYYEMPIPYYFSQPSQQGSSNLDQFYPHGGWAIGCSASQNSSACFDGGVGYIFYAHPAGEQGGHDHYDDLSYQLWAYGTTITDAGGTYMTPYSLVPMSSYSLLVNGYGSCQPPDTDLYPFYSRIFGYEKTSDLVYMAADGTNGYPTRSYTCNLGDANDSIFSSVYTGAPLASVGLQRVNRHVLFVKDKYFVVYDDFASQQPATFTSLFHVLENTLTPDFSNGAFSYTSNIQKALPAASVLNVNAVTQPVTVKVQYINSPDSLNIQDQNGSQAAANPIISAENYGLSGEALPRAHAIWTSNATKATSFHIMTVIYPIKPGDPAPTISSLNDFTAEVTDSSGSDVISFDRNSAPDTTTILVDLSQLTPLSVTDDITGATLNSVQYVPPPSQPTKPYVPLPPDAPPSISPPSAGQDTPAQNSGSPLGGQSSASGVSYSVSSGSRVSVSSVTAHAPQKLPTVSVGGSNRSALNPAQIARTTKLSAGSIAVGSGSAQSSVGAGSAATSSGGESTSSTEILLPIPVKTSLTTVLRNSFADFFNNAYQRIVAGVQKIIKEIAP